MYTLLKCKVYLFWTRGCIHVTRASVCTMYTCFRKWRRLRIRNFTARIRGMPTNGATCIRAKRRARRFFMYTHAEKKHFQCILIFKRSMLLARASVYKNSSSARRMYTQKAWARRFSMYTHAKKKTFSCILFFKRSMLLAHASVYTNSSSACRMYTQKRGHGDFPCIRMLRKNCVDVYFFSREVCCLPTPVYTRIRRVADTCIRRSVADG